MSEQPVTADQPPAEPMSFTDKAAGIFYEPSRVFGAVKTSGVKFVDWFTPLALLIIVGCLASYVQLSSPDLRFQIVQQRESAIEKSLAQGKITSDQASQQRQMIENTVGQGSSSAIVFAVITIIVFFAISFFILSLVWFLVGRFALKSDFTYTQAMAVTGLSDWVVAVGLIFAIVIAVLTSRIDGGLQLGMFIPMDPQNAAYVLLSKIDLFTLWSLAIISIGLGIFSGKKGLRAGIWVFGIWVVWIFSSFAFTKMFFG